MRVLSAGDSGTGLREGLLDAGFTINRVLLGHLNPFRRHSRVALYQILALLLPFLILSLLGLYPFNGRRGTKGCSCCVVGRPMSLTSKAKPGSMTRNTLLLCSLTSDLETGANENQAYGLWLAQEIP